MNIFFLDNEKNGENTTTSVDGETDSKSAEMEEKAFVVPVIKYKPSADCSYTQLISKIRGTPIPIHQPASEITPESETIVNNVPKTPAASITPALIINSKDVEVKKISTGLMGLVQNYNSDSNSDYSDDDDNDDAKNNVVENETELNSNGNGKTDELKEIEYHGVMPPESLQIAIDKTASYVAKNGTELEEILRTRQEARFLFLDRNNEYNDYYNYKVQYFINPYQQTKQIEQHTNGNSSSTVDNKPEEEAIEENGQINKVISKFMPLPII